MKALINYKLDEQGHKIIINAQKLHTSENIDFEIVNISDSCEVNKLDYDENNNLVEDLEKIKMANQIIDLILEKELKTNENN